MAEYYYLVCSLPDINWESEPSLKSDRFLTLCADWLSEAEKNTLANLTLTPPAPRDTSDFFAEKSDLPMAAEPVVKNWYRWETALRNRLVRQRAGAGQDVGKLLRGEPEMICEIEVGITEAWNHADPQEREHVIDRLRWRFLEELENSNTFNFGYLCLYKLKLLIKEKWLPRRRENGREMLEQTIVAVEQRRQAAAAAAAE